MIMRNKKTIVYVMEVKSNKLLIKVSLKDQSQKKNVPVLYLGIPCCSHEWLNVD